MCCFVLHAYVTESGLYIAIRASTVGFNVAVGGGGYRQLLRSRIDTIHCIRCSTSSLKPLVQSTQSELQFTRM